MAKNKIEKLKIVQMNTVLFKADALSNIIRKLDAINKGENWQSNIIVDLFSDYKGIPVLASSDYSYDPLLARLSYLVSRFMRLSNKVHWLKSYASATRQYRPNVAKNLIESADIRIWHYGAFYTLFRQFHDGDILYFHGITPPYLSYFREFAIFSKNMLQAILDLHPFVIVDSQFMKQSIADLGFKTKDIHVLPLFHSYNLGV